MCMYMFTHRHTHTHTDICTKCVQKSIKTEAVFTQAEMIWFDTTSTIVGYLMLNPVFMYVLNIQGDQKKKQNP